MEEKNNEIIKNIIKKLAKYLKFELKEIDVIEDKSKDNEDNNIVFKLQVEEPATLIGKHGETLNHFQHIVRMMFRGKTDIKYHFSIDVNDYKIEHKENIVDIVNKAIQRVIREDEPIVLEPMNAYERRIAHQSVSNAIGITSESIGEEPNRKVVIKPLQIRTKEITSKDIDDLLES